MRTCFLPAAAAMRGIVFVVSNVVNVCGDTEDQECFLASALANGGGGGGGDLV